MSDFALPQSATAGAPTVQVLFFAQLSRQAGVNELNATIAPASNVRTLATQLEQEYGLDLAGCMVAINEEYADPERILENGDEVAFLPPVAGGAGDNDDPRTHNTQHTPYCTHCELTEESLHIETAAAFIQHESCGAQAYFVGTVRSPNDGQAVQHIDYEAFVPMAQRVMHQAADLMRAKHGHLRIFVQHRLGRLLPAEASILIGVASPHRQAALDACSDLIEYFKRELPVWKYEQGKHTEGWVTGQTVHDTL